MNVYIWLDDERPMPVAPFDYGVVARARNYDEAVLYLTKYMKPDHIIYIDFDHDLGEGKSGYDVAKWILKTRTFLPSFRGEVRYRVHSMNPVGRVNIEQLLDHYGYERF